MRGCISPARILVRSQVIQPEVRWTWKWPVQSNGPIEDEAGVADEEAPDMGRETPSTETTNFTQQVPIAVEDHNAASTGEGKLATIIICLQPLIIH